ncbi:MFS general substrate transporter [Meredithblackwellia eburnea MCA 4105]
MTTTVLSPPPSSLHHPTSPISTVQPPEPTTPTQPQAGPLGDVEKAFGALPGGAEDGSTVVDGDGAGDGRAPADKSTAGSPPSDGGEAEKGTVLPAVVPPPADPYPDGGLKAWATVLGAWCVSFTTWGFTNSFGVFQSHYKTNQLVDKSPSDISWIGSFQLSMVLFGAMVSGKAFDAGYVRWLLIGGTIIYAAGLFGLSFAKTYTQIFLAQGVASGIACGILFLPAASSVSHHFLKKRATALGILATGSSLGGVVYPILENKLFTGGRVSFGWVVRAAGFLTIGLLIIACCTITTRLPPRKGGAVVDFKHFKDPAYSSYVVGAFLIMWGLYTPMFYLQSYAVQNGIDRNLAFYALSILNASSLFGRLIPNWLADTYGPLTILVPNCFISGILIFLWLPMGKSEAGMIVFAILFGFSSGAYVSMFPASIASMTLQMNQIGIRIAMAFLLVGFAALTGTPISGAIITHQKGSYVGAAVCSGVMVLVGSVLVAVARQLMVRKKGTQFV